MDDEDIDVAHTAQREAFEEIGLKASDIEIWGRLGVFPGTVCTDCCSSLQLYLFPESFEFFYYLLFFII